jgi:hypothetical protein
MTEQQAWIIPGNPSDMAPLPVLKKGEALAFYERRTQTFGDFVKDPFAAISTYSDFESCRAAMIVERSAMLDDLNKTCRELAASIEHIKTIPTATFPNVSREVREQGQQQEEAKAQEETKAEEVKPAPELKKKPLRS